jgi:hypothetical protein
MIEQALRIYLLSKPAIVAAVGGRIHVGDFVPLAKTDLPAIGIETDAFEKDLMIDGTAWPLQFPAFDIVVKALQFSTAVTVCELVEKAFRAIPIGTTVSVPSNGATISVQIVQVDINGQWNEKEENHGHALAVKPRILKIKVGWNEPTDTI